LGQKTNPNGFRIGVSKQWRSRWFAGRDQEFGDLLHEDLRIRTLVKRRLKDAAVPEIIIERHGNLARVTLFTARPGIVIGRKGADIERLRADLAQETGRDIYVELKEIKEPDTDAQLVAENVAMQLERRISFRRALKRAVQLAMDLGVQGVRIQVSGRLNGAELSRREWYKEGKVPLHTLTAPVQYGFAEAHTTAGLIGVKAWICKKEGQSASREVNHALNA